MADRRERGAVSGRRRTGPWLTAAFLLLLFAGLTASDALWAPAGPAPAFTLTSTGFENGTLGEPVRFSLADHAGEVVVLDMMAVNCPACRIVTKEMLKPLYAEFGGRDDFAILSIDTWADDETGQDFGFETRENLIQLQKDEDVPWRHALDTDDVWRKYQAIALPKVVVVDRGGDIVYESGPGQPDRSDLRSAVKRALAGTAEEAHVLRLPLFGLASVAGVAAFFAPCSIGLVPAYFGLLLGAGSSGRQRVGRTLQAGLATAAGVVSLYAVLALLLLWVGSRLVRHLDTLQVVTGLVLVAVGLMMFRGGLWDGLARRLGMGRIDGRRGFFAFGLGFGLASFACTGPVFLPILLQGFARGPATGLGIFALYGGSLAFLLLLAAGLVASGRQQVLRRVVSRAAIISRVAAALFVLAGVYVLWYHYRAAGTLFW